MTTAATTEKTERGESFIAHLEKLLAREDRAALAALRRGLGRPPGEAMEMHPIVAPLTGRLSRAQEDAYYIVAALFGLYPKESWRGEKGQNNLGASLRWLARESGNDESVERRFVALLNAHEDEVHEHLRQIVSLLKSKEVPINWAQLLRDVTNWSHEQRFVQRSWSKAFWGASDAATSNI